ncbi:hypothetical protein LBWT_Y0450 (plasmid) [Leptolyngbya boryana IAM M-101]|nr:hypothetical protein LBWT_Y0450 [Leptolyngbya boryana IAM M-101]BAS66805.1 hypothetical protein LBDG_Y0450 [Leptolyngbya boryana dg5]
MLILSITHLSYGISQSILVHQRLPNLIEVLKEDKFSGRSGSKNKC